MRIKDVDQHDAPEKRLQNVQCRAKKDLRMLLHWRKLQRDIL
jgi:hypothetical protein